MFILSEFQEQQRQLSELPRLEALPKVTLVYADAEYSDINGTIESLLRNSPYVELVEKFSSLNEIDQALSDSKVDVIISGIDGLAGESLSEWYAGLRERGVPLMRAPFIDSSRKLLPVEFYREIYDFFV